MAHTRRTFHNSQIQYNLAAGGTNETETLYLSLGLLKHNKSGFSFSIPYFCSCGAVLQEESHKELNTPTLSMLLYLCTQKDASRAYFYVVYWNKRIITHHRVVKCQLNYNCFDVKGKKGRLCHDRESTIKY